MSMTVDSQHNTVSDIAQVNQGQPHCAKKRRADAPQTAPSGPKARLSACRTDKPSSLMSVERACSHSTTAPKSRRCRAHTTPPRAARWSCAGAADALPAEPRPAWWRPPAVPRWRGSSARPRAPTSRRATPASDREPRARRPSRRSEEQHHRRSSRRQRRRRRAAGRAPVGAAAATGRVPLARLERAAACPDGSPATPRGAGPRVGQCGWHLGGSARRAQCRARRPPPSP